MESKSMVGLFTSDRSGEDRDFRLAVLWAGIGTITSLLAVPYVRAVFSEKLSGKPLPHASVFALQAVEAFLLILLAVWVGLRLGAKVGLGSPFARALVYALPGPPWSPKQLGVAAALGAAVGVVGRAGLAGTPGIAAWKGLLVSFYGGITEELFLRLFAMSVLVWIGWRVFERARPVPSAAIYWAANLTAAVLFGLGHLPAVASTGPLTLLIVARVLIFNAIGGIVFGVIFWRSGIEHAMLSHFVADVVVHGIFPA